MSIEANRILLVEDDPNDVELVQLALEPYHLNASIDIATDGEQALRYLLQQDYATSPAVSLPRLVLLDLKLPKVSGLHVLQTLRAHPKTRRLVVVVMTSSQEDSDLTACYELGVNSYIVKPLEYQQFVDVARNVGLYWMVLNIPPPLPD